MRYNRQQLNHQIINQLISIMYIFTIIAKFDKSVLKIKNNNIYKHGLDIVRLIETSPVKRFSEEYQSKFIERISQKLLNNPSVIIYSF